jgi:hypothetical protein
MVDARFSDGVQDISKNFIGWFELKRFLRRNVGWLPSVNTIRVDGGGIAVTASFQASFSLAYGFQRQNRFSTSDKQRLCCSGRI